jgi:hypothetical protein
VITVRKDQILGVAAVLVLVGAGVLYFVRSRGGIEAPTQTTVYGVCLACKAEGQVQRNAADMPPFTCPTGGERAFYAWALCKSCKARCVPVLEKRASGDWAPPAFPKCPVCGADVSAYDPHDLDYMDDIPKPIKTLPLPKWPPQ